jgi:ribosome-associated toxin RatA of RatAB toxin-antitoxin module
VIIRKFARVDAPRELVREIFLDAHTWADWMPSIKAVRVVVETDSSYVLEVDQEHQGRHFSQVLDCQIKPYGMKQTQISGWFKTWEAYWRFIEPPDARGTTVSFELETEVGLIGLLIPRRMIQRLFDELFADMIKAARSRVRGLMAQRAEIITQDREGEAVLQVYETPGGLEIVIGGKKYRLEAVE